MRRRSDVKLGQVAQPLRAALTGSTTSPGLFEVMAVLGRAEALARLADAVEGRTQPALTLCGVVGFSPSCRTAVKFQSIIDNPAEEWAPMTQSNYAKVTLSDQEGKATELSLLEGTMGPSVIDIRKLYADTGRFTYDPGYTSTASCTSKITYIDGEEGVLLHRGYPIEELATKSDFLEVAYLHHVRRAADRGAESQVRP